MKKCNLCERKHYSGGLCQMHWRRANSANPRPTAGMDADERFAHFTAKTPDANGCINFIGNLNRDGYGVFWAHGRSHIASRWAWIKKHGMLSDDLFVCHTCDNPSCINTDHMFAATNPENTKDKVEKSRQYMKISPDQVLQIFEDARPIGEIAEAYGVCHRTIDDLLKGRTRHTKDNPELLDKVKWRKFRSRPLGEVRARSKITESDVVAICEDERAPSIIAKEYGVSSTWIHKLKAKSHQQEL